ncbi:MAG: SH3 domain-containing protein [Candidatus Omnitrophica bacterium]|nr:SH3 domain-containing protein [Candidatus Omnitrophota bacterium]
MNKLRLVKLSGLGLACLAVVFSLRGSFAQGTGVTEVNRFFYQGNSDYKEAKYDAAIDNYAKVLNLGLQSGNLYYNLGNSYFKKKELGKTVLNYEKALFFNPNDSDLKSNYEYAVSFLNLDSQSFGNWFEKFANRLFQGATINFLTIFLSVIYIIAFLALIFNLFFNRAKKNIKILFFVLIVLFVLSVVSLSSKITYLNKGAIVISKEADVKFEPLEKATTYFKLTEGNKVEILEKAENWYKIKRPDGKIGWIDKKELGLILDLPE